MARTLLFNPEALINKVNMLLKGLLSSLDCKLQEGRDYSGTGDEVPSYTVSRQEQRPGHQLSLWNHRWWGIGGLIVP